MGSAISVNTVVNNVSQQIDQKFVTEGNSKSEANCTQTIKNVTIKKLSNCNISFSNKCYADAQTTLISTADLSVELWHNLSSEQKAAAALPLTTTLGIQSDVNNVEIALKQSVENYCKSRGYSDNVIALDNVVIDECVGERDQAINIVFENLGNAKSNCVMNLVTDVASKALTTESASQTGFNWSDLLWPIVVCIIVLAVIRLLFIFKTSTKDKIDLEKAKQNTWSSRIETLRKT